MQTGKFILAVLLGGIVLFLWGFVSHEVLPLYNNSILKFTNEDAVTEAIVQNAPVGGVYFLPYVPQKRDGMTKDQFQAAQRSAIEKLKRGPFLFGSVRLKEVKSAPAYFGIQFLSDLLTAFFLALIILNTAGNRYSKRLLVCIFVALAGFAVKSLPMWNWYSFSGAFTLAELIDFVGRMFFAGLVLAKLIPPRAGVA